MSAARTVAVATAAFALATLLLTPAESGAADRAYRSVTLGMNARVMLDREVARIAVGAPGVLQVEVLSGRELLALGRAVGKTNLLVWYADGSVDEMHWTVRRDVSLLQAVLRDIHPGIQVASAPDRDAIILRGVVPDLRYSRLAEAAAVRYLRSNEGGATGPGIALPTGDAATGSDAGEPADTDTPLLRGEHARKLLVGRRDQPAPGRQRSHDRSNSASGVRSSHSGPTR